jgi:hypothetical protein
MLEEKAMLPVFRLPNTELPIFLLQNFLHLV